MENVLFSWVVNSNMCEDNQNVQFDQFFHCCISFLWRVENFHFWISIKNFTYRWVCVWLVGFYLFHSLSLAVKFVWRYWLRVRMCVCVWVWCCFERIWGREWLRQAREEIQSKMRKMKWRNQKWIVASKWICWLPLRLLLLLLFCCCCWFCTHTHNDRPSLWSMWTKNIRIYCSVNTLHTADGSSKNTLTNTHTLQILQIFNSILAIFTTILHKIYARLAILLLLLRSLSLFSHSLSLRFVEPLLYFWTMSTITKTSCCDDTTLCIINTTPHTRQRKYQLSHCTLNAWKRWHDKRKTYAKMDAFNCTEWMRSNQLRCDLNFVRCEKKNLMNKTNAYSYNLQCSPFKKSIFQRSLKNFRLSFLQFQMI